MYEDLIKAIDDYLSADNAYHEHQSVINHQSADREQTADDKYDLRCLATADECNRLYHQLPVSKKIELHSKEGELIADVHEYDTAYLFQDINILRQG